MSFNLRLPLLSVGLLQFSLAVSVISADDEALSFLGTWPPHGQGAAEAVAVAGSTAYVANGFEGLQIIDVGDPHHPKWLGKFADGHAGAVAVRDDFVYLTGAKGLQILDVSEPAAPRLTGSCRTDGNAYDVVVEGHYAYIADGYGSGMCVINILNPSNPQLIARIGLMARAVDVASGRAYTANRYEGMTVFDVSRPGQPRHLGEYRSIGEANDIFIQSDREIAFLAGGSLDETNGWYVDGLLLLDVSDPSVPRRLGGYRTDAACSGVTVSGDFAYLTIGGSIIDVLDVSDPSQPRRLGNLGTGGKVVVSEQLAFVAAGGTGLEIYDVHDPVNPLHLGAYDTWIYAGAGAVMDNFAYLAGDGLTVLDLSTREGIQTVWADTTFWTEDVKITGKTAWVAAGDSGLLVYDLQDATRPKFVTQYRPGIGETRSVEVSGHIAYMIGTVWDEGRGTRRGALHVLDVTDQPNPIGLGSCETGGGIYYGVGCAYRVAVGGSFLYVADGEAGLGVIDVSNPRQPKQVNRYDTGNATKSIGTRDNFCFVVDYGMGFQVIDARNPLELQRLWVDPLTKWSSSVALVGNLAYIAGETIFVFDISDPRKPTRIGGDRYWGPAGLVAGHGLLLQSAGIYGLNVFELVREARFITVEPVDAHQLGLHVRGTPGAVWDLQRSVDLNDWADWKSVVLSDTPLSITDGLSSPQRFYRLAVPR